MVVQSIPQISSLTWVTTLIPLVTVLLVTALKDIIDDVVSQIFLPPEVTIAISHVSCQLTRPGFAARNG